MESRTERMGDEDEGERAQGTRGLCRMRSPGRLRLRTVCARPVSLHRAFQPTLTYSLPVRLAHHSAPACSSPSAMPKRARSPQSPPGTWLVYPGVAGTNLAYKPPSSARTCTRPSGMDPFISSSALIADPRRRRRPGLGQGEFTPLIPRYLYVKASTSSRYWKSQRRGISSANWTREGT